MAVDLTVVLSPGELSMRLHDSDGKSTIRVMTKSGGIDLDVTIDVVRQLQVVTGMASELLLRPPPEPSP